MKPTRCRSINSLIVSGGIYGFSCGFLFVEDPIKSIVSGLIKTEDPVMAVILTGDHVEPIPQQDKKFGVLETLKRTKTPEQTVLLFLANISKAREQIETVYHIMSMDGNFMFSNIDSKKQIMTSFYPKRGAIKSFPYIFDEDAEW